MKNEKLYTFVFSDIFIFISYFLLIVSTCYLPEGIIKNTIDIFCVLISLVIILTYIIRNSYSKFTLAIILFFVMGIISSYLGKYSTIQEFFIRYYKILPIVFFTDMAIKMNKKGWINSLNLVFVILITINFVSMLIYPKGLNVENYSNFWFFRYDNTHIFYFLPAICLAFIRQKKWNIIYLMIIISFQVFYCFSANSVFAYTLLLIYVFIINNFTNRCILNSRHYVYIFYGLFIIIIILRLQDMFSWLIIEVLNKDLSFTGRTSIWDKIIELIRYNPILGYGYESPDIISRKLGNAAFTHAHNTILDIVYKGGIISGGIFIYIINIISKELNKFKENYIMKIMSVIFLCILIMFLFEAREDKLGLYILFTIFYNCEKFKHNTSNSEEENKC